MRDTRGRCISLSDNDFGERECPFFKTAEQRDAEEEKSYQWLLECGRADLIAKYHIDEYRMAKARRQRNVSD